MPFARLAHGTKEIQAYANCTMHLAMTSRGHYITTSQPPPTAQCIWHDRHMALNTSQRRTIAQCILYHWKKAIRTFRYMYVRLNTIHVYMNTCTLCRLCTAHIVTLRWSPDWLTATSWVNKARHTVSILCKLPIMLKTYTLIWSIPQNRSIPFNTCPKKGLAYDTRFGTDC